MGRDRGGGRCDERERERWKGWRGRYTYMYIEHDFVKIGTELCCLMPYAHDFMCFPSGILIYY